MNLYQVELNQRARPTLIALETIEAIINHIPGLYVVDDMHGDPEGEVWTLSFPVLVTDWNQIPELPRNDPEARIYRHLMDNLTQALRNAPHGGTIKPIDITHELESIAHGH
jgi:hypothetical protein